MEARWMGKQKRGTWKGRKEEKERNKGVTEERRRE